MSSLLLLYDWSINKMFGLMRFSAMRLQKKKTNSESWIWVILLQFFFSSLSLVNDKINIYHFVGIFRAKRAFFIQWSATATKNTSSNEIKWIQAMVSSVLVPFLRLKLTKKRVIKKCHHWQFANTCIDMDSENGHSLLL